MTPIAFSLDYWCVLIAALLPVVCAGIAKSKAFGKPVAQGGFDNANPREWLLRQSDWRSSHSLGLALSKPPCSTGLPKALLLAMPAQTTGNSAAINTHQ